MSIDGRWECLAVVPDDANLTVWRYLWGNRFIYTFRVAGWVPFDGEYPAEAYEDDEP
jgi:hypothetical protein